MKKERFLGGPDREKERFFVFGGTEPGKRTVFSFWGDREKERFFTFWGDRGPPGEKNEEHDHGGEQYS